MSAEAAPMPLATIEENDGCVVRFGFHLDQLTAHRFGIKPRVVLRLVSGCRVQDSGVGQMAVYWDRTDGGHDESYDGYHVEPYFGDGKALTDNPRETMLVLLKRAFPEVVT